MSVMKKEIKFFFLAFVERYIDTDVIWSIQIYRIIPVSCRYCNKGSISHGSLTMMSLEPIRIRCI